MVTLTHADHGSTVTARAGERLRLDLPENPTTGFAWVLEPPGHPSLEPLSDDFAAASPPRPGGGGTRTFVFRLGQPGVATVRLRLKRAWEDPRTGTEEFAVTVKIEA